MSTLRNEERSAIALPDFADRLIAIGKCGSEAARWFPYAYEAIIFQWAGILREQEVADRNARRDAQEEATANAAARTVGVAVAAAPMLYEIIKQSLAFRVARLFRSVATIRRRNETPPLILLDGSLLSSLEQVVCRVTDACLDFKNFDSWDLRQTSIKVNNATASFLRDMFSYISPTNAHRLVLVYLSRFLTKNMRQTLDRESSIGLRCSWEVAKIRLHAVSAFTRYPDIVKICGPQMLNWGKWWTTPPKRSTSSFFDEILQQYDQYRLSEFAGVDDAHCNELAVPHIRPHWLTEIIVDCCVQGTEHTDQYIQERSASVLHELFWSCSQESIVSGISSPVASMLVTFVDKLLRIGNYIGNFHPKSPLRKDILSCFIFVLQSAHSDLLRALWRCLCSRMSGQGESRKHGGLGCESDSDDFNSVAISEPTIYDMFSVLNLCLRTTEYEGKDDSTEVDNNSQGKDHLSSWQKEFLPSRSSATTNVDHDENDSSSPIMDRTTSISRRWQAHDSAMVIIKAGHQIVRELHNMLMKSPNNKSLLNPAVRSNQRSGMDAPSHHRSGGAIHQAMSFSRKDVVSFIRAITSLYLHALALRSSDVVLSTTFVYSAEVIKVFGIKLFLEAIGETLQHWMRVVTFQCGARRAQVRIAATDLLEFILRSTWECYGSFFRIRVPLLAVQTEVMERIVATAAARYYREQRKLGISFEAFTNAAAEASLVPLWRTLRRVQNNPASENVAFRGALIRIAGKLKVCCSLLPGTQPHEYSTEALSSIRCR